MLESFTITVSVINVLLTLVFIVTLIMQYMATLKEDFKRVQGLYRLQPIIIVLMHLISYVVLMNVHGFTKDIVLLYLGSLGLFIIVNIVIDQFFYKSMLPLWSISQFLLMISFVILARLNVSQAIKQLYWAAIAYSIVILIVWLYDKITFTKYLGIPAIIIAFSLLLMTNATIGGATNWLQIGTFSFQPSEIVQGSVHSFPSLYVFHLQKI